MDIYIGFKVDWRDKAGRIGVITGLVWIIRETGFIYNLEIIYITKL
jgi:hypothetical protein